MDKSALASAMIGARSLVVSPESAASSTFSSNLSTSVTCPSVSVHTRTSHRFTPHGAYTYHTNKISPGKSANDPTSIPSALRPSASSAAKNRGTTLTIHLFEQRCGLLHPCPATAGECDRGGLALQPRNLHPQPPHALRRVWQRARSVLQQLPQRQRRVPALVCVYVSVLIPPHSPRPPHPTTHPSPWLTPTLCAGRVRRAGTRNVGVHLPVKQGCAMRACG